MKKILLVAAIVGISGLAHATGGASPTTPSTVTLAGVGAVFSAGDAYSWGIAVGAGEAVSSASITFTDVELFNEASGTLYTDFLKYSSGDGLANSLSTDATSVSDSSYSSGDYWTHVLGSSATQLGHKSFLEYQEKTWTYTLSAAQLATLNSYLQTETFGATTYGGFFDIGITPNCHYQIQTGGSIQFTYGTTPCSVPDVSTTALLLVMALGGVEVFRRQSVLAKTKA